MIRWSVSQSAAWRCPRQWWFRHVANAVPAQPDAARRGRGRAVHAALERAYFLADQYRPDGFMHQFTPQALEVLYNTWGKDQPLHEFQQAASEVADVLLRLPVPRNVLGVEYKIALTHTDDYGSYEIVCVLDLALRTGPASAHIRDWKSGNIDGDLSTNSQLAVYDLAARTRWPWLTDISVGLYSVRHNRENSTTLTPQERDAAFEGLLRDASDAYARVQEVRTGAVSADEAFPPRPEPDRCSGCAFRSYCPLFASAILPLRRGLSLQDVATERNRLTLRLESVNRNPASSADEIPSV